MIQSILLAAALQAAAPTASTTSTDELAALCNSGFSGDREALTACTDRVSAAAEDLESDPTQSTCLHMPVATVSDLVWTFLDWHGTQESPAPSDHATGVATALLARYPCGWIIP